MVAMIRRSGFTIFCVTLAGCGPATDLFDFNSPRGEWVEVRISATPEKSRISLSTHDGKAIISRCSSPCVVTIREFGLYEATIEHEDFPTQSFLTTAQDLFLSGTPSFDIGWYNPDEVKEGREKCVAEIAAFSANEDQDAAPCIRIPPIMPSEAERSGHCKMTFDISADGKPMNIEAEYCTEPYFETFSIHAIKNWLYYPKYERGVAVLRADVETKMTFILQDEFGREIKERKTTDEMKANWKDL